MCSPTGQPTTAFDLPTGRYRLDAGRKMRTLKSIMDIAQVKQLVDQGDLVVEA